MASPLAAVEELSIELLAEEDVVRLRQAVRGMAGSIGFSPVEQTKIITAASELARNTVIHGGGGQGHLEKLGNGPRQGIRLSFVDQGPGIADVDLALQDGFTSGTGLGLGLSGSRRLSDEFQLDSTPGEGTRVTIVKWKR